ncbi:MAG: hypothetical protein QOH85_925, partial [Acidobacteriaceae bacterium]|nr:hypothetical protein [Acidobacteriaceae bacterium]
MFRTFIIVAVLVILPGLSAATGTAQEGSSPTEGKQGPTPMRPPMPKPVNLKVLPKDIS